MLMRNRRLTGRPEEIAIILEDFRHLTYDLIFGRCVWLDAKVADYSALVNFDLGFDIVGRRQMIDRIFE